MKQNGNAEQETDMEGQPRYSLIIPFSPAMRNPKLLLTLLASALHRAENDIRGKYSKDHASTLIEKLRDAMHEITCVPEDKTLAVFVSQFSKKTYYFTPTKRDYMPSARVLIV